MPWNIGNTSVRNPWRIQAGLRVFSEGFSGDVDGGARERDLVQSLVNAGVVESARVSDWHGRKWRSCFTKLGFATYKDSTYESNGYDVTLEDLTGRMPGLSGRPYELTPSGRRLLEATSRPGIGDAFLRQLRTLELPSPTEQERLTGPLKPFILLLQFLSLLEERSEEGLNKAEIAAFLQTASSHNDIDRRLKRLLAYRRRRERLRGTPARRGFDLDTIARELGDARASSDTLMDYADTTVRYCFLTGVLTLRGSRLEIRQEKRAIVEALLSEEPRFLAAEDPLEYLVVFYAGAALPTDDKATALEAVGEIQRAVKGVGQEPVVTAEALEAQQPAEVVAGLHLIDDQYQRLMEERFAREQFESDTAIDETIAYLEALGGEGGRDVPKHERPAYLEWAVWRAILAFDHLAAAPASTRNFELDADLRPVDHAPSGAADLVVEFDGYVLVGEATLTGSSRQEAAEGEPVRRHVADVVMRRTPKSVYGLFVAPRVDPNTVETFRTGLWYAGGDAVPLNIVPMPVRAVVHLLTSLRDRRRTPDELRQLLDRCLASRNASAPIWLRRIEEEAASW